MIIMSKVVIYLDISYFQKINNTYKSKSKQETELFLLNRHVDECFADSIDYHIVKKNGEPFELLIIKDTDGNTFKKKIKSKHSTPFNLGDYIEWNGQIWLITLLDPNEKTYHSGYMYLCTVPLIWQNSEGKIIERYAYSEDFTKYSSGTTGNNAIIIGDNQYGLTLPIDEETRKLHRDMRFAIDFEDAEQPDIYGLTNRKVNLNNNEYFGRGGTMILTMSYDAFNKDNDKFVDLKDGRKVWVCDYKENNTLSSNSSESITPSYSNTQNDLMGAIKGSKDLKVGISRTYIASIIDEENNVVKWDSSFSWNVNGNLDIKQTQNENKIELFVADDSLIGESFLLQIIHDNKVLREIEIDIVGIM